MLEVQKVLEGEKYVTISMVPTIIISLRTSLVSIIDNNNGDYIRTAAAMMVDDFNDR